jgi:3-oxoacyl-[acyl-carrier protein] reductase
LFYTPSKEPEVAGQPDRVALVTGASRGIGAATAMALARSGAAVALAARSAEALDEVAAAIRATGGQAFPIQTDMADPELVESLVGKVVDEFGGVDILVNNAGILPSATRSERVDRAEWDRVLAINLTAPWLLASRAHDSMAGRGGGVVVNVTSTASFYPSIGLAHYCSAKAALEMTTKTLALEWARDRIRVLSVAPGRVDTDLVRPIVAWDEKRGARPNPLNRLGTPDEVGGVIAFLCSDAAAYITGSTIGLATST